MPSKIHILNPQVLSPLPRNLLMEVSTVKQVFGGGRDTMLLVKKEGQRTMYCFGGTKAT